MVSTRYPALLFAVVLAASSAVQAQDLPTTQPALITIYRETVKTGRVEEHSRLEAGWPAAYGRVSSPDYYLALQSITGAPEAWFISPYASYTAQGASMMRDESNATLSAELARLSRADADLLDAVRTIQATARPDLSFGKYPDLTKQRFWEITIFRVRPGHDGEFAAAAKAYGAAAARVAPNSAFRTYEVTAGMVGPTYLVFSSLEAFGGFDAMHTDGDKTMGGATAEEQGALMKAFTDAIITMETNRYRLDPRMSYVSAAVRATDPAFWNPKPAPRRTTTGSN